MRTRTECPESAVPVLVRVVAVEEFVVEVRTELELKHSERPEPLVQRLHRPRRRAVRPHFGQLGIPGV